MASSQPNPHLVKCHRSYAVDEIARLFDIHRNTVRQWIKRGLPPIDKSRPVLVHGTDLADYLRRKRGAKKQRCAPGEMFCMRCQAPRRPAGDRALYRPLTALQGNLSGRCAVCAALMFRRVSLSKLAAAAGSLAVTPAQGGEHIDEGATLSVNRDFAQDG